MIKNFGLKTRGSKKFLFGLALSLVLAMAIGSFAIGENQTPVTPQVAAANDGTGDFVVDDMTGCSFSGGVLTIGEGASPIISMKPGVTSTTQRIEVTGESTITLNGVKIDRSSEAEAEPKAALTIAENAAFNVNITLAENSNNTLIGEAGDPDATPEIIGSPGIEKSDDGSVDVDQLGKLTIGGTGQLTANGGDGAAGIGGGCDRNASKIAIESGTVIATGEDDASGIGGGGGGSGSYIWITGGTVTATGGDGAAGIGGGCEENGSYIWITGGKVKATALLLGEDEDDGSGAGIGGGYGGNGSYITISGGEVTSTASNFGAGIGGGFGGNGTDITISGGVVAATGGEAGAGIGGGGQANGEKIKITGGVIKATGGLYMTYPAAGIGGGGMGSASDNKLDGDAVVMAASGGDGKDALEGFVDSQGGSLITRGIVFTGVVTDYTTDPYTIDWKKGEQYGDVVLESDLTMPENATLTIPQNKSLTINAGKTFRVPDGAVLTNDGTLTIKGTLSCTDTGKVETLLNYDPQGGEIVTTNDEYITYQNASGVQTYGTMPDAERDGYSLDGWYTEKEGKGTEVLATDSVLLNQHTLYANWVEPGPEPTPTPPGPEPEPEPTPDPSVNPDGDGSGSSSKTSDPFMGGIALALLGVATTGAVLVRKRK